MQRFANHFTLFALSYSDKMPMRPVASTQEIHKNQKSSRRQNRRKPWERVVPPRRIELRTRGFSGFQSTKIVFMLSTSKMFYKPLFTML